MDCQSSISTIHPTVNAPAPSLSTGTGTSSSNAANTSIDEGEGDIMQSNWGADVFEMVTILRYYLLSSNAL